MTCDANDIALWNRREDVFEWSWVVMAGEGVGEWRNAGAVACGVVDLG